MVQVYSDRDVVRDRITPLIDNLFRNSPLFQQKLKREEIIPLLSTSLKKNLTVEQLATMTDNELTRKLRRTMVIEAVSGTLNDLAPEEIARFDAAVKRK